MRLAIEVTNQGGKYRILHHQSAVPVSQDQLFFSQPVDVLICVVYKFTGSLNPGDGKL